MLRPKGSERSDKEMSPQDTDSRRDYAPIRRIKILLEVRRQKWLLVCDTGQRKQSVDNFQQPFRKVLLPENAFWLSHGARRLPTKDGRHSQELPRHSWHSG